VLPVTVQVDPQTIPIDRPKSGHRADIQGLRAVAVVLVVAFHAGLPLSGGFIGVDMFFVISGFVITGMLTRQLEHSARLGFASFYTRRMRRLLPALALVIVVVAVCSTLFLSPLGPQQATARTGIAASLFTANIELGGGHGGGYFALAAETNAFLHTWSLSVEEQFYLVFPALLVVAWRIGARYTSRRSRRRTAAAIVLVATTASFAWCYLMTYHPSYRLGENFAFYSASSRAWEFGVGVLLALAATVLARLTRRLAVPLGLAGAGLVAFGAVTISGSTAFPGLAALLPVTGTALLLLAGMTSTRGVSALLGVRPAVWIGDVSYGWYLWHWPLIVFGAALWPDNTWVLVAAAIASLVPTWLSHRFVETPIRFNDRLTGRRMVPLVVVCIAVPIAACLGLLFVNRLERHTDVVTTYSATTRTHSQGKRHCYSSTPVGQRGTDCTWSVDQPRGTIYLVGDSNAEQFSDPVAQVANGLGYDLTVVVDGGCPFGDVVRKVTQKVFGGPACHRFVMDSVRDLADNPPALVIVASSSSTYVNGDRELRDPRTGEVAATTEAAAQLWEDGLTTVLSQLHDAGIPTLVIHPVPHLVGWDAANCPTIRIFDHSCGASISRDLIEQQQQPAREAENRAIARVPGVASADFTDDICSTQECSMFRDGTWFYRDGKHLSIDGSFTLTDRFRELIAAELSRSGAGR
jgi:peptidoglycan/LPS O-acetylase OafA/YrhL